MIYDGPRDSFVQNAKLALKLADTDVHLWANLGSIQRSVVVGGPLPDNKTPSRPRNALSNALRSTPTRYSTFHTLIAAF